MGKNASTRNLEMARAWEALQTILPPELLHAPLVNWDEVNPALLRYLYTQVREAPWLPHPLSFGICTPRYGKLPGSRTSLFVGLFLPAIPD